MPTANINILAVLVAAVLTFVLGAVWYSPVLFAKQWMAAQGYTPEKLEEIKRRGVTRAYAVSVLCYLVTAYVMALLASYTNSTDRKSTRLNSSHTVISYAVFCLKKKNKKDKKRVRAIAVVYILRLVATT